MSEIPPPGVAAGPVVPGAQTDLTVPALETALDDFRRWFESALATDGPPPPAPPPGPDLATLLNHYLGLRQEVNLQTRAVRAQQEQNAELVTRLGQAVELLTRQQARSEQHERQALEEKVRPLLTSLIELHDTLFLASRETQRVREQLLPLLEELTAVEEPPEEAGHALPGQQESAPRPGARSFWSRWILSPAADRALRDREEQARQLRTARRTRSREIADRASSALSALLTGYTMSLERIDRALNRHGLEPIETAGQPFDPEEMEVLEAVADSSRAAGEVLQEVRRGYRWNGRVFRFAQVRVARG